MESTSEFIIVSDTRDWTKSNPPIKNQVCNNYFVYLDNSFSLQMRRWVRIDYLTRVQVNTSVSRISQLINDINKARDPVIRMPSLGNMSQSIIKLCVCCCPWIFSKLIPSDTDPLPAIHQYHPGDSYQIVQIKGGEEVAAGHVCDLVIWYMCGARDREVS